MHALLSLAAGGPWCGCSLAQGPGLGNSTVHAQDVRRQLYSDKDDREIFSTIQDQLRRIDKLLEDGRAALQHLEMALINVACDDPGAAIGAQLVLPLLQVQPTCSACQQPLLRATGITNFQAELAYLRYAVWPRFLCSHERCATWSAPLHIVRALLSCC